MDPELRRVHTFIYDADFKYLEKTYGYGWSSHIREIIHQWALNDLRAKNISLSQTTWRKINFGEG